MGNHPNTNIKVKESLDTKIQAFFNHQYAGSTTPVKGGFYYLTAP